MKFFKNDLNCETFTDELSGGFYTETQGGFDRLADEINARIDSSFKVSFDYNQALKLLGFSVEYTGVITRSYYTCFTTDNMTDNISRIEDILTAFACGLGFNVN